MLTLLPWYVILQRATSCFGKSLKTSIVGLVKAKSRLLEDCAENYNFVKLRGRWDTMQLFLLLSGKLCTFCPKNTTTRSWFYFQCYSWAPPLPGNQQSARVLVSPTPELWTRRSRVEPVRIGMSRSPRGTHTRTSETTTTAGTRPKKVKLGCGATPPPSG